MTIIIQVVGRAVTIGLATESMVLGSVDATWQVGTGRSFLTVLIELLGSQSCSLDAVSRIVVASDEPSYTTIRTVLVFVNTLAWGCGSGIISLPSTFAGMSLDSVAASARLARAEATQVLFPMYE